MTQRLPRHVPERAALGERCECRARGGNSDAALEPDRITGHTLSLRIEWNRVELTSVRHVEQVAIAHADHHDADRFE